MAHDDGPTGRNLAIAGLSVVGIAGYLVLRFLVEPPDLGLTGSLLGMTPREFVQTSPLLLVLVLGGVPLVLDLGVKALRREFGSDLLAGISIVASVFMDEFLAGALVVLMLSGGEALEEFAVRRASSVLEALARRLPSVAHRKQGDAVVDLAVDQIQTGDVLVIFPHEICPVDGVVLEGHGVMDESYLTGEPFMMSKTPGSEVLSGSINGENSLTIRASRLPVDSRYAKIMEVMAATEQRRPRLRRLGDQLGAWYTPLAVGIAVLAWALSGDEHRFLAVLVVATPCPLLIAIPVAIIGSISVCAARGIVIKNPAVLEQIDTCQTMILDKTGTLTYGRPEVTEQVPFGSWEGPRLLRLVASLERYSKHPLASAFLEAARREGVDLLEVESIREAPGQGLLGRVDGHEVQVTSRSRLGEATAPLLPPGSGLECVVLVDGDLAGWYRFRDEPRHESRSFIGHLGARHGFARVMIVSGDREEEVRYLAEQVGIEEIHASQSPEQKVAIVQAETARARTIYLGDGINDAPALMAATVGIAFGQNSDVTAEAAGAVIMESTLERVDEFLHVGRRMRGIALQSALGGMAASVLGMGLAAFGFLSPVAGAVLQEVIDLVAVLNALRAAFPKSALVDFHREG